MNIIVIWLLVVTSNVPGAETKVLESFPTLVDCVQVQMKLPPAAGAKCIEARVVRRART